MTQARQGADPAAMADILASIRRIVAEEDRKFEHSPLRPALDGEVLVLTPAMRIDVSAPRAQAQTENAPPRAPGAGASLVAPAFDAAAAIAPSSGASAPTAADVAPADIDLSADEAVMVDIARAVAQEEVARLGAEALRPLIVEIVREEVARALRERS